MTSQIHGIAYTYQQSIDYTSGRKQLLEDCSPSYSLKRQRRLALKELEIELDRLESIYLNSPQEKDRIDELYQILC